MHQDNVRTKNIFHHCRAWHFRFWGKHWLLTPTRQWICKPNFPILRFRTAHIATNQHRLFSIHRWSRKPGTKIRSKPMQSIDSWSLDSRWLVLHRSDRYSANNLVTHNDCQRNDDPKWLTGVARQNPRAGSYLPKSQELEKWPSFRRSFPTKPKTLLVRPC